MDFGSFEKLFKVNYKDPSKANYIVVKLTWILFFFSMILA